MGPLVTPPGLPGSCKWQGSGEQGSDFSASLHWHFYIGHDIWLETNHYRIIDTLMLVQPHIDGKLLLGLMVPKRALSLRVTRRETEKDAKVALRTFDMQRRTHCEKCLQIKCWT